MFTINSESTFHQKLLSSMSPIFVIGQFLCTVPFPLYIVKTTPLRKALRIVQIVAGWLIFAIVVSANFTVRFYTPEFNFSGSSSFFIRLFHSLEHIVDVLLVAVICIGCQLARSNFYSMISDFSHLLQEFNHLRDQILHYSKLCSIIIFLFSCIAGIIILILSMFSYGSYRAIPFMIGIHVPLLVTVLFVTQYAFFVCLAINLLREVNRIILALSERTNNSELVAQQNWKPPSDKHLIFRIRKLHLRIAEQVAELNRLYGVVLLLIVISVFANLNINCLAIYHIILVNNYDKNTMMQLVMLVLVQIGKLLAVVVPNSLVKSENHKTAMILCHFKEFDGVELNCTIDRYLQQLQELKDVCSVYGVIQLDMSLLVTMTGSITTYMVILIQFDKNI